MENLTACLAAPVFLAFAGHRLTPARGGGADPAHRDVAGFALCAGMAMLLNAPAVLGVLETVEDEAAWLVRVARAFTRSPVVRDVRDRARAEVTAD